MPALPTLTRRRAIGLAFAAGSAGMLSACTSTDEPAPGASAGTSAADGDATTPSAVALDEAELVARYDAVLASLPDLDGATATLLADIRDQHAQHRDALGGAPPASSVGAPEGGIDGAIAGLLALERRAAKDRRRSCVAAPDPESARLLALIGASEASHVPALREVRT